MKSADRAYLAGFFDGEGCVGGYDDRARIQVVNNDRDVLEWLQRESGGIGRIVKRQTSHAWVISHRDEIRVFVRLVVPYARLKRAELLLADELARLTTAGGRRPVGPKQIARYEEAMCRRRELAEQLRKRPRTIDLP